MPLESRVKTRFFAKLRQEQEAGEPLHFEKIQQRSIRGTADVHICWNGWFVAVELKRGPESKPDPVQRLKLLSVRRAGGVAVVINSKNMNEEFERIKKLCHRKKQ